MEKVVFAVMSFVIILVCPANSVVEFYGVDNYDGTIIISYTTTEGERPRGIALNLFTDGYLTFDYVESWSCFNVCLDYAFDNSEGYAVGDGDPIADPAGPGVGILPATEVSVCVGYLDEDGDEILGEPGPGECTNLITLAVSGGGDITVAPDTLRGPDSGVVSDGSKAPSNLPIVITFVGYHCDCPGVPGTVRGDIVITEEMYELALSVGCPVLWCQNCFPNGDADGSCTLSFTDVSAVIAAWPPNDYAYNADFNWDGQITFSDVSVLINHWPPNPGCDASCVPGE